MTRIYLSLLMACAVPMVSDGGGLQLVLPLGRTAYQCNEFIPLSVLGRGAASPPTGELVLTLGGEDGSRLVFNFPAPSARAAASSLVEHLRINGWLLRPGAYSVEAARGGQSSRTNITVLSHLRRSDFKLINWRQAQDKDQLAQGEDSLGFNLCYGNYGGEAGENFIRAGVDYVACCVMAGGHQMDLRQECDWSDPYVIRGGTRRVVRRAFMDRTRPNVPGVHFYDEPGLTWANDPQTGEPTPHAVPWQLRQYEAAFGRQMLDWKSMDPGNPEQTARWGEWARWKLGFLDAGWQDAQFGVSQVEPGYVCLTQSQYGYSAFSDGYYFNVARSLPITSGHGGYHDFGPGYFNPVLFLEMARARDFAKPNWYLPTGFGSTTADQFRLEQYLCFQCGLQGLISPPDIDPGSSPEKSLAAQGLVESNHLLQRLGPIFNTMPVTRPPVALLFSLSQFTHAQALNRKVCYAHDTPHGRNVPFVYLAGKLAQHQFMPLLDEEVRDGTLAAHHRAIILTSLDYLDAEVIAGLEQFARQGGLVLLTADSTVQVSGAVKLEAAPEWPDAGRIAELNQRGQAQAANKLMQMRQALAAARQLADAIGPLMEKAGIHPPLTSTEPGIVVTRQAAGDVEYLFAVNATHDPKGDPMLGMKAVRTTLTLPNDGKPVYDAVGGCPADGFHQQGARLSAELPFGPGQMRVFARTTRPIGSVAVGSPTLRRDYTMAQSPLRFDFGAAVLDDTGALLSGSIPLQIVITDPLGATRYDLYRASQGGLLRLGLPLGVNDPPGDWKITVTELLNNRTGAAGFKLPATSACSAMAGAVGRAIYWPADRQPVFRFFREHQRVTLVKGRSDFNTAAAERLERILKPWNITCAVISEAEANKPRSLSEDEARTWIGLDYAGRGAIQPGSSNAPLQVGYAVRGPVILLGSPADNALTRLIADQHFLPFQPQADSMPGPGRGCIAWQREALGVNQESITLIAFDAVGMDEVVGTLDELLAGLEPLTPLAMPRASAISPATRTGEPRQLRVAWTAALPDRITGLKAEGGQFTALTRAETLSQVSADGRIVSTRPVAPEDYSSLEAQLRPAADPASLAAARAAAPPNRLVKLAVTSGEQLAVAYWGGTVCILDKARAASAARRLSQDVTALAWLDGQLLAGDADGKLVALSIPALHSKP
ncbi:MAG: hypothetical protein ABSH34_21010 [Verrucomicrobiota bacterium]